MDGGLRAEEPLARHVEHELGAELELGAEDRPVLAGLRAEGGVAIAERGGGMRRLSGGLIEARLLLTVGGQHHHDERQPEGHPDHKTYSTSSARVRSTLQGSAETRNQGKGTPTHLAQSIVAAFTGG